MNVTITPSAEKFILRMVRFGNAGEDAGFRLSVTAGGCSGLASEFSVEAAPRPGDSVVEVSGVKLFLPAESRLLLDGVTIDFADTPLSSGLTFIDPKAKSCACSSAGPSVVEINGITRKH
ncbi:MAG: iron-sulfur cluster assembly accessory protein [Pseudomonadota bacterium]